MSQTSHRLKRSRSFVALLSLLLTFGVIAMMQTGCGLLELDGHEGQGDGFGHSSWGSQTPEQKQDMMRRRTLPEMQFLFRQQYKKKYSNNKALHCGSCHGIKKFTNTFDPGTPSTLYPLDPNNMPKLENSTPEQATMLRFMEERVMPKMRQLLGPGVKVTCFSCHAQKDAEGNIISNKRAHPQTHGHP